MRRKIRRAERLHINYVGNVIRPPSEAKSIILPVTVGCSYNKCTFCGAYKETAEVLNKMAPNQIAALTLIPLDNTPLGREVAAGTFTLPTPTQILQELYVLISHLQGVKCQFHANHASNYLPLAGRPPRDKDAFLESINLALAGTAPLVPDHRRAL